MPDDDSERTEVLADLASAMHRLEIRRTAEPEEWTPPTRRTRRRRLAFLNHWNAPGPQTPWWVFGLRLGFWLLIGAGVQTAGIGDGWHPDTFTAALGIAEVGWRTRTKVRARRRTRENASPIWIGTRRWTHRRRLDRIPDRTPNHAPDRAHGSCSARTPASGTPRPACGSPATSARP